MEENLLKAENFKKILMEEDDVDQIITSSANPNQKSLTRIIIRECTKLKNSTSTSRRGYLKTNSISLDFGMKRFMLTFIVLVMITNVIQVVLIVAFYPLAKRVTNMVRIYNLGIETYNSLMVISGAFFQTILWNNTSPMWGTQSLALFESHTEFARQNILIPITDSMDYDLGNFTDTYRTGMFHVS